MLTNWRAGFVGVPTAPLTGLAAHRIILVRTYTDKLLVVGVFVMANARLSIEIEYCQD